MPIYLIAWKYDQGTIYRSRWLEREWQGFSQYTRRLERWKGGRFRDVSIPISCISSHISREQVNFFQVGTSNKAFQIYSRRETRRGQRRVISPTVLADNRVVRESFIVQGARLFIPFHSIPLHRIPSFESIGTLTRPDIMLVAYIFVIYIYILFFIYSFIFPLQ